MPVGALEPGSVLVIVALIVFPIAGFVFVIGATSAFDQVGSDDFSFAPPPPQDETGAPIISEAERKEEIRQMIQARNYRREAKGEPPIDVDAEVERILAADSTAPNIKEDKALRSEVRQLVIARNDRRERQGKKPLDVEKETERQLRELENLGQ